MKKYYQFGVYEGALSVGKAWCFDYAGGATGLNDTKVFFPKSQCIETEPNDLGNKQLLIPTWLFRKNNLDPCRIRANYNGEIEI